MYNITMFKKSNQWVQKHSTSCCRGDTQKSKWIIKNKNKNKKHLLERNSRTHHSIAKTHIQRVWPCKSLKYIYIYDNSQNLHEHTLELTVHKTMHLAQRITVRCWNSHSSSGVHMHANSSKLETKAAIDS